MIENQIESFEECSKKITVETLPDYFVLYERRKGNYKNLEHDWSDFCKTYAEALTFTAALMMICTWNWIFAFRLCKSWKN